MAELFCHLGGQRWKWSWHPVALGHPLPPPLSCLHGTLEVMNVTSPHFVPASCVVVVGLTTLLSYMVIWIPWRFLRGPKINSSRVSSWTQRRASRGHLLLFKAWPAAHSLCLCGCVSLLLPQHDLFLLFRVFLLISLVSSPLQIGGPADRPCSAIQLGGGLGGQAKVRQQPVQHIPVRVSVSLSLSCFSLQPKQALLPTLSLSHVFWVVLVPAGGKCGVHLEEVSLTPAPHPRRTPVLPSNLPAAPGHACALASDPPQISLVLFSLFVSLHPPSAHVLGTLGQSEALRWQGQQGRDYCTVVNLHRLTHLSSG